MSGERAIRAATAVTTAAVAAFAAVVSYSHIYDLGRGHGQFGTAARLLPLSVDGLILAASLVLLHEARAGHPAAPLGRWMLGAGVAATVAANVAYGARFGPVGALVSAWPALAFIGSAEMGLYLVRVTSKGPPGGPLGAPPSDAQSAAAAALRATVAAGNGLSQRQLMARFALSRSQADKVRQAVLAESDGRGPE